MNLLTKQSARRGPWAEQENLSLAQVGSSQKVSSRQEIPIDLFPTYQIPTNPFDFRRRLRCGRCHVTARFFACVLQVRHVSGYEIDGRHYRAVLQVIPMTVIVSPFPLSVSLVPVAIKLFESACNPEVSLITFWHWIRFTRQPFPIVPPKNPSS